jgi:hypothetical protein
MMMLSFKMPASRIILPSALLNLRFMFPTLQDVIK